MSISSRRFWAHPGAGSREARPEMRPRSFRVRPADDDELLAVQPFGFAPGAAVPDAKERRSSWRRRPQNQACRRQRPPPILHSPREDRRLTRKPVRSTQRPGSSVRFSFDLKSWRYTVDKSARSLSSSKIILLKIQSSASLSAGSNFALQRERGSRAERAKAAAATNRVEFIRRERGKGGDIFLFESAVTH